MGLEKSIQSKKEKRKNYRGSKSFDKGCRNNNSCPYCKNNRLHSRKKAGLAVQQQLDCLCDEWNREHEHES